MNAKSNAKPENSGKAPAPESATVQGKGQELAAVPGPDHDVAAYLDSMGSKLLPVHKKQFVALCHAYRLNPFLKEIYGVPYTDRDTGETTFSVIVGYEVYLKRAERSGRLRHWEVTTEKESDGELKATITIERKDREKPFRHEVYYSEYVQTRWDTGKRCRVPTQFWATKPRTMLKKVAIAQGFRLAFPIECGGMPYAAEEIDRVEPDYSDRAAATAESPFVRSGSGSGTGGYTPPTAPANPGPARFEGKAETAIVEQETPFIDIPKNDSAQTAGNGPGIDPVSGPAGSSTGPVPVYPAKAESRAEKESASSAPSPAPESIGSQKMKVIQDRFSDRSAAFDSFLQAKAWIKAGEAFPDISDAQIERLYNNIDAMDRIFTKWIADGSAK